MSRPCVPDVAARSVQFFKTHFSHGEFLCIILEMAGCNDCHTPGFAMKGGKVPESEWLTGDTLGWQGPWVTFPSPPPPPAQKR